MNPVKNARQQIDSMLFRFYQRRRHGMRPGLERIRALLEKLDNPQEELATIHIAGTNGKGSVAAMLSAILHAAGYPTGRFTSPHLLRFNERFFCREAPVDDTTLLQCIGKVEEAALELDGDRDLSPSFFECATATAFLVFRQQGIRLAVVETGLGGRLDATNVLFPLVSVITRIGLDHCQWLGSTLAEIAAEKAGIIKPGRPLVRGAMPREAAEVIEKAANRVGSPVLSAEQAVSVEIINSDLTGQKIRVVTESRDLGTARMSLGGSFQAENAASCVATCEVLREQAGLPVPDQAILNGLAAVVWPGRCQWVNETPPILVDGAHNSDAALALRRAIRNLAPRRSVGIIIGMCDDKEISPTLRELAPMIARAWTVPVPTERSANPEILQTLLHQSGVDARVSVFEQAAVQAAGWAAEDGHRRLVLICGSLFLAGQALAYYNAYPWPALKPGAGADANEKMTGLNMP